MEFSKSRVRIVVDDAQGVGPSDRTRAILWLTLAYWGLNVVVFTFANFLQGHPQLAAMFVMRLAVAAFGIALCFAIQFLLRRLERRTLWKRLLVIVIVVPIAAEIYA